MKTVKTVFRLIHVSTGCALHGGKNTLPKWYLYYWCLLLVEGAFFASLVAGTDLKIKLPYKTKPYFQQTLTNEGKISKLEDLCKEVFI